MMMKRGVEVFEVIYILSSSILFKTVSVLSQVSPCLLLIASGMSHLSYRVYKTLFSKK